MRGSCHALTVGAGLNVHHHRLCARRGGRVRRLRAGTWRFSRPAPADRADDHHLVEFITDYLRMMVSGNMNPLEIENLMDQEIDTHHHEAMAPSHALQKAGDGLPAFGIVAAVMGVVKTMASVGQPPAILGEMIAAALVGTFLGILISYGFVGPLAQVLEQKCDEATKGDLQGIADYFQSPLQVAMSGGSGSGDSTSLVPGGGEDLTRVVGQRKRGEQENRRKSADRQQQKERRRIEQLARMEELKSRLDGAILDNATLSEFRNQIRDEITPDGWRIQIVDDFKRPMFDLGGATVK